MAWCRQAASHYLSQCWSRSMSPYDVIRPQWVKMSTLVWFLWVVLLFLMDLDVAFTHIIQGCFTGTGAIIWLPQCLWGNPEWYGYNKHTPNHNTTQQSVNCVHNLWAIFWGVGGTLKNFWRGLSLQFPIGHPWLRKFWSKTYPWLRRISWSWVHLHDFKEFQAKYFHYNDVIMETMASQITSLTIVYSTVNSGADQRKHESSASLAFVRGIHRGPVNSPHKWPVTRKMFPFDDFIMFKWNFSKTGDNLAPKCQFYGVFVKNYPWLRTSEEKVYPWLTNF